MRDVLRLLTLCGLGLGGLLACWYGISGENRFHDQIGWVAGAIGSLIAAGIGMVRFILAGLRSVHGEASELMTCVRVERLGEIVDEQDELFAAPALAPTGTEAAGYVTGPSMTRVHRPDCPQVRGKDVGPIADADIARLGLHRCGVCCP
jgi:hypothetical protein